MRFPLRVPLLFFKPALRVCFTISIYTVENVQVWIVLKEICEYKTMNTTYSVYEAKTSHFYATILASSFQTMLNESNAEARGEIIFSFLPFHTDLGVGEDFLRNIIENLGNAEEGSIGEFSTLLVTSPFVMSALRKVIYGSF